MSITEGILQALKREASRKKQFVQIAYGLQSRDYEANFELSFLSTEVLKWNNFDNTYQATQQVSFELQKIEQLFIKYLLELFQISPGSQFVAVDFDFVEMDNDNGRFTAQVKTQPPPMKDPCLGLENKIS